MSRYLSSLANPARTGGLGAAFRMGNPILVGPLLRGDHEDADSLQGQSALSCTGNRRRPYLRECSHDPFPGSLILLPA